MKALEKLLHEEIPLSKAMGITVVEYTGTQLTLHAPLQNNTNHKSTAFGGSLYAVAVLSGWGLLHLKLKEQGLTAHIVIQESHAVYQAPVAEDITAVCAVTDEVALQKFIATYTRRGRARITLRAEVRAKGLPAFLFDGTYVVHA